MPVSIPQPTGFKISQLLETTNVSGAEYVIVATGGVNRKVSLSTIMSGITNPNLTLQALGLDQVDNTSDINKPISTAVQNALNGKADASHTHTSSDITDLATLLSTKADVSALATKADVSHTHGITDVTGLQTVLDSKADTTALAGKADVNHTHAISDVTGLQSSLDSKAPISHGHAITDVSGLQTALDAKSDVGHTHTIANVSGLQTALDSKADASHTHLSSDISDLTQSIDARNLPQMTASVNLFALSSSIIDIDVVFSTLNGYYTPTLVINSRYKLQSDSTFTSGQSVNFIDGTLNYTLGHGPFVAGTYDFEIYLSDVNNPNLNVVVQLVITASGY